MLFQILNDYSMELNNIIVLIKLFCSKFLQFDELFAVNKHWMQQPLCFVRFYLNLKKKMNWQIVVIYCLRLSQL